MPTKLKPPIAKKIAHHFKEHGQLRLDNYHWLINKDEDPDVVKHLEAENQYTDAMLEENILLKNILYQEIKNRNKQDDTSSVPYKYGNYYYYHKKTPPLPHPIYYRTLDLSLPGEIILDINQLAGDNETFDVETMEISPNEKLLAYSVDVNGDGVGNIFLKDLKTGEVLPDVLSNCGDNIIWANDNQTIFYNKLEQTTLRSYVIYKHKIGEQQSLDKQIYLETDESFNLELSKTTSKQYIIVLCDQTDTTESIIIDANNPDSDPIIFTPRKKDHKYYIDSLQGTSFIILSDFEAPNFCLMQSVGSNRSVGLWQSLIPHRADVSLESFHLFQNFLVLEEKNLGLNLIRIKSWDGKLDYYIDYDDPTYSIQTSDNYIVNTDLLKIEYSSLATPSITYQQNMYTKKKDILKKQEIPGGFNRHDYTTERLYAPSHDGTLIPISIIYKKNLRNIQGNPLMLYGYGSYGNSVEAAFNPNVFSLIDRGFLYAIAHIRGGEDMGKKWYISGKCMNKKNTFLDFIYCAKHLIKIKYADPQQMYAHGASAGGLLMGAVVNMEPKLFHGILSDVPFMDVLTTMLDQSRPFTTSEYDDWGNPNNIDDYRYMKSYSPYDNLIKQDYPNMLVTAGFLDKTVSCAEAAKYVAKLRELKTDKNLLFLKTYMEQGHDGASSRSDRYEQEAFQYSFILMLAQKFKSQISKKETLREQNTKRLRVF